MIWVNAYSGAEPQTVNMENRLRFLRARIALYRKMLREPRSGEYYNRRIIEAEEELRRLQKARSPADIARS